MLWRESKMENEFEENFRKDIQNIAEEINKLYEDGELFDSCYINDCLDIEYRCNARKEYRSCEICIGYGGPDIFIDTQDAYVKEYWGSCEVQYPIKYEVSDAIDDYMEEMFNC